MTGLNECLVHRTARRQDVGCWVATVAAVQVSFVWSNGREELLRSLSPDTLAAVSPTPPRTHPRSTVLDNPWRIRLNEFIYIIMLPRQFVPI